MFGVNSLFSMGWRRDSTVSYIVLNHLEAKILKTKNLLGSTFGPWGGRGWHGLWDMLHMDRVAVREKQSANLFCGNALIIKEIY
jgi:hypothetical protein